MKKKKKNKLNVLPNKMEKGLVIGTLPNRDNIYKLSI